MKRIYLLLAGLAILVQLQGQITTFPHMES